MGLIASAIKEKLAEKFNPSHLDVIDESHKHAGHAGARQHAAEYGAGESHFHVIIQAEVFRDMSRLARHRAVMETLSEEMQTVHALRLEASGPE